MDDKLKVQMYDLWNEQGKLPGHGDILGTWLAHVLKGKQTMHIHDADGKEIVCNDYGEGFNNPYRISYTGNSVEDPLLTCAYEIKFHWDQWVVCYIKCNHGTFEGTADFLHFTEAMIRAVGMFNTADHPEEIPEEDLCKQANCTKDWKHIHKVYR